MTERLSTQEKHALVEAASVFGDHGMDFRMPWECDLDDLEAERFRALRDACRAYHAALALGEGVSNDTT